MIGADPSVGPSSDESVAVVTSDGYSLTWGDLYREYAPAMVSYARSRGVRAPEDLVQDVLVTTLERLPDFEGDRRGLRSLLFTIAYRRIADEHRKYYRRREVLVPDDGVLADHEDPVVETVTSRTTALQAMHAFEILSERERKVLEMRIIDEAAPAVVAAALGLSNGNVRVIQARALVKVRKYLTALETRNRPMGSITMFVLFLRSLRSDLPDDEGFIHWIDELHIDMASIDATGPATGEIAAGAVAAATGGGLLTVGAVKVGLFVTLATASTIGSVVVVDTDLPSAPLLQASGQAIDATAGLAPLDPGAVAGSPRDQEPDAVDAEDEPGPTSMPVPGASPNASPQIPEDTPPTSSSGEREEPLPGPPSSEERTSTVVEETGSAVGEVVQSVDEEVVDPLVEEVVVPVVEEVVEPVVDDVVNEVVEPVVDEVVEEVVDPVVEEVVDPVVEEVVDPLVDEVVSTLLPGVGGLLPG